MKRHILIGILLTTSAATKAIGLEEGQDTTNVNTVEGQRLSEVTVSAQRTGRVKGVGIGNTEMINAKELLRAACCNLGESFTTNPSVDVNYADAATGAQQIKLLGLSGTYVQMLTENIPNYRGAAAPFSLGYIPGPWMQSIQVSKGASSVKNGYESITGQINVEFKKPQATPFADANLYYNTKGKLEANVGANLHLSERWRTALLGHYEILDKAHDDNGDGFVDMPKVRQGALQSRWAWMGDHYVFQASVKGLKEHREGGQIGHHATMAMNPYTIDITNERYEAFTKNAYIFNKERATNVALILSGSLHHENAEYGLKLYNVDQRNGYASLMFESDFGEHHNLSTGISLNHDFYDQRYRLENTMEGGQLKEKDEETTPGAYAQYTYKLGEKFTLMGGLRWDHSNIYGSFVTPRMHVKYSPNDIITLRGSVGKGYRTNHVLAENNFLLASGRQIVIDQNLDQEEAWNYGISAALKIPIGEKTLELNAEYYYTNFIHQLLVDLDTDPHTVHFTNLDGDSYSHTYQFEATYPFFKGFTLTATYRRTNVKSTYNGVLKEKPLTNKYKGLLTASYAPGLGKWQFDVTLQLNGGGRMPTAYTTSEGQPSWDERYKGYEQLSAQVTRFFRHWSIYAGGENITGFKQKNPIIGANDPWGSNFDSTMIWGPVHGAVYYIGVRLNWKKI
ncbi:MAG: TonB-dependent receptor [Prevotella sp.]|nr:TonB-dependent receptor [Prevotella sp.]